MGQFVRKLFLLSWKNLKVLQRHYIKTAFEILIPILLFGLIAWMTYYVDTTNEIIHVDQPTYFEQYDEETVSKPFPREYVHLYYAPSNNFTDNFMEDVRKRLDFNRKRLTPFSSEVELENSYLVNSETLDISSEKIIGVVFTNAATKPKILGYKIRTPDNEWKTEMLFPIMQKSKPMDSSELYFRSGFIALQQAIDWSFIDSVKPASTPPVKYYTQQFPYPPYTVADKTVTSSPIIGMFFIFGFLNMCINVVGKIVEDKQSGITELLKLMGLSRTMLWLSWFIRVFVIQLVIVSLITFFLTYPFNMDIGGFYRFSSVSLIWVFFVLSAIAFTAFWFTITTFFSKANMAVIFSSIIWVLLYSVPRTFLDNYEPVHMFWKIVSCLNPSICLYWGLTVMETFESRHVGLLWGNIFKPPSGSPDDMKMIHVLTMLIFDILFYGLLTFYLDAVLPGAYGIARPYNFLFTKSYWTSGRVDSTRHSYGSADTLLENYEGAPLGLKVGIRVAGLTKKFGTKTAVDGVNLDIYQDQITALLGHNGAGKTTTMSIITGMLPATGGSVWVNERNVRTETAAVRESLGLCPQHNMLFTDLTVTEHLMFFAMLKNQSYSEARASAQDLLPRLQLTDKANSMISSLSGGMKRKVSLGVALVGGARVVVLDEPTSGLDPEARRHIWDLLLSMRGQRTILVTTHFMEEADVLGDRIAIMDHGRVQCYGTSLFLKNRYGAGYVLKLLTNPNHDAASITQLVESTLRGARLKSRLGSELAYTLPQELKPSFPALFDALESRKAALGITSVGVSLTTLEDVFLRVGNQVEGDQVDGGDLSDQEAPGGDPGGSAGVGGQLAAMLIKRAIYARRKWIQALIFAVLPIAMILGTVLLSSLMLEEAPREQKPLRPINLNQYPGSTVMFNQHSDSLPQWFSSLVPGAGSVPEAVAPPATLSSALLDAASHDLSRYREEFVVAAEVNGTASVGAMYSGFAYHSAPIAVNLLNNALLKNYTGGDYGIVTANHPLIRVESNNMGVMKALVVGLLWQLSVPLGLVFLIGGVIAFPLVERVSAVKQLQLMSGVRPVTYWLACFVWDMAVYLVVAAIMVATLAVADVHGHFGGATEAGVFALLLLVYGLGAIPYAYVFSYFKSTSAKGFSFFLNINFLFGLILPVVFITLNEVIALYPVWSSFLSGLTKVLYVVPQFALAYAIYKFSQLAVVNNFCSTMSAATKERTCATYPAAPCCPGSPLEPPRSYTSFESTDNELGIGLPLTILAVDAVIYWLLILLIDHGVVAMLKEQIKRLVWRHSPDDEDQVDADVRVESERVQEGEDDALTVRDLMKVYGRKMLAVKGVSFGVMSGECFGLLGFNGAGKTTTFKMLTGDERATRGDAWIRSFSLHRDKAQFLSQIGYCPQFDAINEVLTGREMLQLFARLRGIHPHDVDAAVDHWLKLMGLDEYADAMCGTYSGGNKRKLSTAMALIGDPPLVFLDEPTTGVDPVARRNLWSVLARVKKSDRAIVLTSHSMEECEALCNRLAIMVQGQFVCIGQNQHLKQRFGQGFTVMLKLRDVDDDDGRQANEVKNEFEKVFQRRNCDLKDQHHGLLHYHLTDPAIPWKTLFVNLEAMKTRVEGLEDYTVSETTLEQVFLSFAKREAN